MNLSALLMLCRCGGVDIGNLTGPVTFQVTVSPVANACPNCAPAPIPSPAPAPAPAPVPVPVPPPAATVPLGSKFTAAPVSARPGNLVWTAGGMTYGIGVFESPMASWVCLYSSTEVGESVTFPSAAKVLDGELDLRPPIKTDAEIRAYLSSVIVPSLNAWLAANVSVFANGYTFRPVSAAPVSDDLPGLDRLAARLPQWLQIDLVNGVPVASLR